MVIVNFPKALTEGIIDLHSHAAPCIFEKLFDEADLALQYREAGYRACIHKTHAMNAGRVYFVNKAVPGFQSFGSVCLNHFVGGLNPRAVEWALALGAKEVKFGTIHTKHHFHVHGGLDTYVGIRRTKVKKPSEFVTDLGVGVAPGKAKGITILTEEGKIKPEVFEILDLIASADVILSTGHLSTEEILKLIPAAKGAGAKKILITHANWKLMDWSLEDQMKMIEMGALIENVIAVILPGPYAPNQELSSFKEIVDFVKKVGADKFTMGSDLGSGGTMYHPIEGMRIFIDTFLRMGITQKQIDVMTKDNPAKLLGI